VRFTMIPLNEISSRSFRYVPLIHIHQNAPRQSSSIHIIYYSGRALGFKL
jgi:hypothetical protein